MAANPWFRLYSEFSHDPKVQMLSEVMQRRYVMLMCMRCSNALETLHETEIAFHLRISEAELTEMKSLFNSKGFIDAQWNLLNWEKRQFASDSSAARVARHREKKKRQSNVDETLQQRQSNALDTDTDTDTDIPPNPHKGAGELTAEFDEAWRLYPTRPGNSKAGAWKAWQARIKAGETAEAMLAGVRNYAAHCRANNTEPRFVKLTATFFGPDQHYLSNWGSAPATRDQSWLTETGFDNEDEARNFGCTPSTAAKFRDGKRIPEAA